MSGPGMGFTGPQFRGVSGIPNQNIRLGQMLQGQVPGQGMAPGVMPMMQPPQMMPPQGMPNTQFPLNPGVGGVPPGPPNGMAFGLANRPPGMLTNGPLGPNSGYNKAQNNMPHNLNDPRNNNLNAGLGLSLK